MSSASHSYDREHAQLLEFATPELYRRNSFRVLGLEIGAESSEARRRQKKLKRKEALGLDDSSAAGLLPLAEAPSREDLQIAQQRIQNPVCRLMDEFFWFWPQASGEPDEAIAALHKGDSTAAKKLLVRAAQDGDPTAIHNLAVFDHLTALEGERGAANPAATNSEARDAAWIHALARWRETVENPETLTRLSERIDSLDDPRLTRDSSPQLHSAISEMILLVSARLAVHALEEGRPAEVARHVWLLHSSGFPEKLILAALRRALAPVDQRIRSACEKAESAVNRDPTLGLSLTQDLLVLAGPLLEAIDLMLACDDPLRQGLQDEVCAAALRCQVVYGNKTDDWLGPKKGLEQILAKLQPSEGLRQRIEQNLKSMSANVAVAICHYCGSAPGVSEHAVHVNMHGDVKIDYGRNLRNWNHHGLKIPRCAGCKGHHDKVAEFPALCGKIGVAIAGSLIVHAMLACAIFGSGPIAPGSVLMLGLFGGFVGVVCACGFGEWYAPSLLPAGVKPHVDVDGHLAVVGYREKGWSFGSGPGKGDVFEAPPKPDTPSTEAAAADAAPAKGCAKCATEHWWSGSTCSLCDAPRAAEPSDNLNESLDVMMKLLKLGAVPMARVVRAIEDGRRGTAAALLMTHGHSAAEAKQIVLGWERRPKTK